MPGHPLSRSKLPIIISYIEPYSIKVLLIIITRIRNFIGLFLKSIYIRVEDEKLRINHGQSRTCFPILSIIFKENFFSARA